MIRISEKAARSFEKKFNRKAKKEKPPEIVYPKVETFPLKHETIRRINGTIIEKYLPATK